MPFTVSHVIAVIPFRKAGLPLLPLAVGSMAPDFFYFTPGHYGSMFGHSLAGVFLATLPMAWLVLWFFRCFLREPLLLLPPKRHQALLAELAGDPPADSRWARPGATALLLLAGIATHLFWDSFTHQEGVMVQHFAVLHTTMLPTPIGPLALARVLQHGCSFAGLGMLAAWYLWLFHRRKTAGILPEPAAEQLPPRVRRLLRLALIAVAAITAMGKVGGKISNVLTNVSNAMT